MRSEVVEAITRSHFVRVSPAEQAMIDRATRAEYEAAAIAVYHAREAKRLLEEMGISRAPSVLDIRRSDVDQLGRRADALREARRILDVGGFWQEPNGLGQALKVAPPERARLAVEALRAGGHDVADLVIGG